MTAGWVFVLLWVCLLGWAGCVFLWFANRPRDERDEWDALARRDRKTHRRSVA